MINGYPGLIVGCLVVYGAYKLAVYLFRNYEAEGWKKYAQSDEEFNEQERIDREKRREKFQNLEGCNSPYSMIEYLDEDETEKVEC